LVAEHNSSIYVGLFLQKKNYVILLIFWLLIDIYVSFIACFLLFLSVLCIFKIILYYVYDFIINKNWDVDLYAGLNFITRFWLSKQGLDI